MVSIHAPAGGATFVITIFAKLLGFNPRARGGRDFCRMGLPLVS
ncbi:MAG: hypothetical protein GQF41_4141 [Candidatus Rifleibacterium amylolyticum]|nr:MAG: hypothetical protein GQF41_4141 [Candidatus Rifleibacterium amylolyticum]